MIILYMLTIVSAILYILMISPCLNEAYADNDDD